MAFEALVELRITGFGFPDALRGLRLQRLAVHGHDGQHPSSVSSVPAWIGEMPLVELAITYAYCLHELPTSLRSLRTFRYLDISDTHHTVYLDASLTRYMEDSSRVVFANATYAIDYKLMPLLSANPQLVVCILGKTEEELDEEKEGSRGWHCGIRGLLKGGGMAKLLRELAVEARMATIQAPERMRDL